MKLRLRDNSVRLRLMRGEVGSLLEAGRVEARTRFPGGGEFRYALESDADTDAIGVKLSGTSMKVSLPESQACEWASTERVSLSGVQPLDGGEELHILVEKDFQCLTPRAGEDESDMYPHPESAPAGD